MISASQPSHSYHFAAVCGLNKMLSTAQQVKETLLIGTMQIGLPTTDVYTDGALVHQLFKGFPYHPCDSLFWNQTIYDACLDGIPPDQLLYKHHPAWATMLLVPFLLNYMMGWYTWYKVDKKKKFTWPACLLGVYPQLRAANIIRELWRNPIRGLAKKRKFERDVGQVEVFLEAVPTTYIMSYMVRAIGDKTTQIGLVGIPGSSNQKLFDLSYFTSIISASLGMAKSLKVSISCYQSFKC